MPYERTYEQQAAEGRRHAHVVAAWIRDFYGERCEDSEAGCIVCDVWSAYDALFEERRHRIETTTTADEDAGTELDRES
jgi:IS1 family transposase